MVQDVYGTLIPRRVCVCYATVLNLAELLLSFQSQHVDEISYVASTIFQAAYFVSGIARGR